MSFTYSGSPSATQSPASPPAAGAAPELVLPSDGDAANVASIEQAFKVLADYAAFERAPFANASQWSQIIRAFYSAQMTPGLYVDHMGLPNGRFYDWTEMWLADGVVQFGIGPGAGFSGRWAWETNSGSAGQVGANPPGVVTGFNHWNNTKSVLVTLDGSGSGKYGQLQTEATTLFTDDCYASMDVDFAFETVASLIWRIGFFGNGDTMASLGHGIYLERPDTLGTNFKVCTIAGGSPTTVDTGISAGGGGAHHLSLQWWGANIADDSAAHAVFILDGHEFDIGTTLPNTGGPFAINPTFGGITTGATTPKMILGPVRYSQITPR